jgi:hypothetical protein
MSVFRFLPQFFNNRRSIFLFLCFFISLALLTYVISMRDKIVIDENLPGFLSEQIGEDLKNKQISKEDIETTWSYVKDLGLHVRYKYVNGRFAVCVNPKVKNHPRYIVITEALENIFSSGGFSNVDFIVSLDDFLNENPYSCPIFTFATNGDGKNVILMPDCEALNPVDREYITRSILSANNKYKWDKKKEVVFWRGSPTGPILSEEEIEKNEWSKSGRFHLAKISEQFPQIIDAAFSNWLSELHLIRPKLLSKFSIRAPVHITDHLLYKYLIDIDGNSCCYSRSYWIMLSNSLMLKQSSPNRQWFYKGLVPNVHFLSIDYDLKNIMEIVNWAKSHDDEVQEISNAAREFALKNLQYNTNIAFLSKLLKEYANCLDFTPCLDGEDNVKSKISLYDKIYFKTKAYLRKKIKTKAIAYRSMRGSTLIFLMARSLDEMTSRSNLSWEMRHPFVGIVPAQ